MRSPYSESVLDCHLEMRVDDLQEVQSFWLDGDSVFVALNVRDRFRSDGAGGGVDRFLFAFSLRDPDLPTHQVPLRAGISQLAITGERLAVRYYAKDYDVDVDLFRREDLEKEEEVSAALPDLYFVSALLGRGDSIFLVGKERAADSFLMAYELRDGEAAFEELCLVEDVPTTAAGGANCLVRGDKLLVWSGEGEVVACHHRSTGERLWRRDFHPADRRVVCQDKMASDAAAAVCFVPKDPAKADSLVVLHDLASGEELYSVESPADLQLHQWQCAVGDRVMVVAHRDEYSGDSVVRIFRMAGRTLETVRHPSLLVNSLSLVPGRGDLAAVTFHVTSCRAESHGLLSVVDLEAPGGGHEVFRSRRDLWGVALKSRGAGCQQKFAALVGDGDDHFVCQRDGGAAAGSSDHAALSLIRFKLLKL